MPSAFRKCISYGLCNSVPKNRLPKNCVYLRPGYNTHGVEKIVEKNCEKMVENCGKICRKFEEKIAEKIVEKLLKNCRKFVDKLLKFFWACIVIVVLLLSSQFGCC